MVNNFRGRQPEHEHSHMDNLAQMPMISIPRVESPLEKVMSDLLKNNDMKCSFPGRMAPNYLDKRVLQSSSKGPWP